MSQPALIHSMNLRRLHFVASGALLVFVLAACQFEMPITAQPTRKVDARLLGNWVSADGKEQLKVRELDDSVYVVYYDGDLFRAFHSDLAGTPFVSVQDLNSGERKFAYLVWKVSEDGRALTLRSVQTKVIPKETKDRSRMQELLKKNVQNPELLGEAIEFRTEK
jgi:hypothetical protein